MKISSLLSLLAASAAATMAARMSNADSQQVMAAEPTESDGEQRYTIEVAPGVTKSVTEDEKWALRRQGINFMDITETPFLGIQAHKRLAKVTYPKHPRYQDDVKPLLKNLSKSNMRHNLEHFTSFHTRYYKSTTGIQSAAWLKSRINETIYEAGADAYGAHVREFPHSWGQPSLIATIPGKTNHTVVIGAHQDSINLFLPSVLSAPGADDDGSGTVTILEAFRVLLSSKNITGSHHSQPTNTIEFHWYSAEEGGLLGSQAIFSAYEDEGRDVKAMLQQDMTGYIKKTLAAGEKESVGVITDFVDSGLTEFIKKIVTTYCTIPYTLTKCGYACSDHASASKAGYPSAFVIESDFKYSDDHIHTSDDLIEYLDFGHMLQHAMLTLGLVYELAFAKF